MLTKENKAFTFKTFAVIIQESPHLSHESPNACLELESALLSYSSLSKSNPFPSYLSLEPFSENCTDHFRRSVSDRMISDHFLDLYRMRSNGVPWIKHVPLQGRVARTRFGKHVPENILKALFLTVFHVVETSSSSI